MKLAIKIVGYLLILSGLAWLGLSIISTPDTLALTFLGVILVFIGIGLLTLSRILGDREKKNCNCCKCTNCSLDHDHCYTNRVLMIEEFRK